MRQNSSPSQLLTLNRREKEEDWQDFKFRRENNECNEEWSEDLFQLKEKQYQSKPRSSCKFQLPQPWEQVASQRGINNTNLVKKSKR